MHNQYDLLDDLVLIFPRSGEEEVVRHLAREEHRKLQACAKSLRHSVEIPLLPPKILFPDQKRSWNAVPPPSPNFNARST